MNSLPVEETYETAIFAGGCFWCTQKDFDQIHGVLKTIVGYTGGTKIDPMYEEVCEGKTGHVEAIQVFYDPKQISYEQLLDVYFHSIDPTQASGQFCDIGSQYRPVIFYKNSTQKIAVETHKQMLISKQSLSVLVDILPAQTFYPAEEYHQKYYKKNPTRYNYYHDNSGREQRLKEIWGPP